MKAVFAFLMKHNPLFDKPFMSLSVVPIAGVLQTMEPRVAHPVARLQAPQKLMENRRTPLRYRLVYYGGRPLLRDCDDFPYRVSVLSIPTPTSSCLSLPGSWMLTLSVLLICRSGFIMCIVIGRRL